MKRSFGNMRLGGRYRLSDRIAFGGMGEVWRALDEVLGRKVAVKILRPELAYDDNFRRRFRAEARTAGALSHPGIAAVYDYGEGPVVPADSPVDDGGTGTPGQGVLTGDEVAYLVMELVPGEPLSALLSRGALGVDQTLDVVAQTARALHAAHERGVVHRDVKPANLLVTPDGTVKVTDFGIARPRDHEPLTMTGQVMGTAHYLAPELARGRDATPLSDVYALGVVMYECLAGRRPFEGDNQVAVATAHLAEPPPPLPEVLPLDVRELVELAMEKEPDHRTRSAAEFAHELELVLRRRRRPQRPADGSGAASVRREIDLREGQRDAAVAAAGAAGLAGAAGVVGAAGGAGGLDATGAAATGADGVFSPSTGGPQSPTGRRAAPESYVAGYEHGNGPTFVPVEDFDGYGVQGRQTQGGWDGHARSNGHGDRTAAYGAPGYAAGPGAAGYGADPMSPATPTDGLAPRGGGGSHRDRDGRAPFELSPRNIAIIAVVAVVILGLVAMAMVLFGNPGTGVAPAPSTGVTPSSSPPAATSSGPTPSVTTTKPTTSTSTRRVPPPVNPTRTTRPPSKSPTTSPTTSATTSPATTSTPPTTSPPPSTTPPTTPGTTSAAPPAVPVGNGPPVVPGTGGAAGPDAGAPAGGQQ
jgi:hypothetical protein